MKYVLQKREPSGKYFGRKADPLRPYVWRKVKESDDKTLLEDLLYKMTDGTREDLRNYRIIDKEANNGAKQ